MGSNLVLPGLDLLDFGAIHSSCFSAEPGPSPSRPTKGAQLVSHAQPCSDLCLLPVISNNRVDQQVEHSWYYNEFENIMDWGCQDHFSWVSETFELQKESLSWLLCLKHNKITKKCIFRITVCCSYVDCGRDSGNPCTFQQFSAPKHHVHMKAAL